MSVAFSQSRRRTEAPRRHIFTLHRRSARRSLFNRRSAFIETSSKNRSARRKHVGVLPQNRLRTSTIKQQIETERKPLKTLPRRSRRERRRDVSRIRPQAYPTASRASPRPHNWYVFGEKLPGYSCATSAQLSPKKLSPVKGRAERRYGRLYNAQAWSVAVSPLHNPEAFALSKTRIGNRAW